MPYATELLLVLTSSSLIEGEVRHRIGQMLVGHKERLSEIVLTFLLSEVAPHTTFEFEQKLAKEVRRLARQLAEQVYNVLEPEDADAMPHDLWHEAGGYRRLNQKTRNAHVATLFGTITLWRYGYRYWHRGVNERTIFPLQTQLGLVAGATPALAEAAARYLANTGATQAAVLDRLKRQHDVAWGAERLRQVTSEVSRAMQRFREEYQVLRILQLLEQADQSKGKCKPVLCVGRDGISLREYRHRYFEVATAGTVTVYDRGGGRLGTVYLAFAPELGQQQMTEQLTALIQNILQRWEGPLPRLSYVTDAGESETKYYRQVLRSMRHPRTGKRLEWYRIVDYYHASERIWAMADALFGRDGANGRAWAPRMCRLLKQRNGPSRVLHSAAAMRSRLTLSKTRGDEFRKAYNYIRRRTKFMQYAEYKDMHLPIGSGVTEAACKTIFTQRLKLSGMRWTKTGAQTILNLRVILLSRIWDGVYGKVIASHNKTQLSTYDPKRQLELQNAA